MRKALRPWTEEDDATMRRMFAEGHLQIEIAVALDRASGTVSQKMAQAGLVVDVSRSNRMRTLRNRAGLAAAADKRALKMLTQGEKAPLNYENDPRPAAIRGPDLLLERMMAGRR